MEGEKEKARQVLMEAGLIMTSESQRTLAETMMAKLHVKGIPTRARVRASLAKLKTPLSAEIIAMRGER
jgi:hypothetical protein